MMKKCQSCFYSILYHAWYLWNIQKKTLDCVNSTIAFIWFPAVKKYRRRLLKRGASFMREELSSDCKKRSCSRAFESCNFFLVSFVGKKIRYSLHCSAIERWTVSLLPASTVVEYLHKTAGIYILICACAWNSTLSYWYVLRLSYPWQ